MTRNKTVTKQELCVSTHIALRISLPLGIMAAGQLYFLANKNVELFHVCIKSIFCEKYRNYAFTLIQQLKYAMYMSFTRDIKLYEIYTMIGQNSDGTQLCTVCHSQFILTITPVIASKLAYLSNTPTYQTLFHKTLYINLPYEQMLTSNCERMSKCSCCLSMCS